MSADLINLKRAYLSQKSRAGRRGIEWCFDFKQWLELWERSGKLASRGLGVGRYVMARRGDVGPYAPSNVEIVLCEVNARDARINHPSSQLKSAEKRKGSGRGWTYRTGLKFAKRPYQVMVCRKYIGCFATQAEAESAYRAVVDSQLVAPVENQSSSALHW